MAVLPAKRDIPELLHIHVANLSIGILNGEHVIVAGLRINPIARRDNAVRSKSRNHVVDNILGASTQSSWRARGRCPFQAPGTSDLAGQRPQKRCLMRAAWSLSLIHI